MGLQEEKPWSRVKRLEIAVAQGNSRSNWKIRLVVGYPYPSANCYELTSNALMTLRISTGHCRVKSVEEGSFTGVKC